METIGNKLGSLTIIGSLIGSLNLLHAQVTTREVQSVSVTQTAQTDSIVGIVAEVQGLQLVPSDQVPLCGTFWTVLPRPGGGVMPPFPCPPLDPSLPIYAIADGQFLVDGTVGGQAALNTPLAGRLTAGRTSADALVAQAEAVVNLITQVQTAAANRQMQAMARAMGMDVPSPGGDGSLPMFSSSYTIDTNGLYLEITNVANGLADLNLHNGTNQVYAIWSTSNLLAEWNVETELWPTNGVTPFAVPTLSRDLLFLRAEDWTGVDSNGDGVPDWWIWKFFADLSLNATNLDNRGNTLLDDYQNGIDPNIINFSLTVTNQHVNTISVPVQLNLLAGTPAYVAVLVNDANLADAVWQPYQSNIVVTLGYGDG